MRTASNILVALAAAAVCGLMTWISLDAGIMTLTFNVTVLAIMLIIIAFAAIFGFRRMRKARRGLDEASKKLVAVYKDKSGLAAITKPGAELFEVEYLDRKYQEFIGYIRKTNSPADIGDYIGEYEINNYTHRHLAETVPDILTSLGILGTFIGLVWGLKNFNPVSYEAMASSITSLIDGIKVAFVTSIYGIALSIAYSYNLKGAIANLAESLDGFTDKYYLCAIPPTDASAMNHVLSNQKELIKATQGVSSEVADQIAGSMADHMDPVLGQIDRTLNNFTEVVTLNQQELLDKMAEKVMGAMKKEFMSEFSQMQGLLRQTNTAQKDFLQYVNAAQSEMEKSIRESSKLMREAMAASEQSGTAAQGEIAQQQEYMRQFIDYVSQAMDHMARLCEQSAQAGENMSAQYAKLDRMMRETMNASTSAKLAADKADRAADRAEEPVRKTRIDDIDELTDRLDQMIVLLEKQARHQQQSQKKRGLFG